MGGITTFMTMVYVLIVIPTMASDAGMDYDAVFTATIISAAVGSLLMGVVANLPIAIAPGLGISAFFAYTIVLQMGYSWQMALAAIFVEGVIFVILSLCGLRDLIVRAIPEVMRTAIAIGIGLFVATIGLVNAKVIVSGGGLATMGDFSDPSIALTLFGVVAIGVMLIRRVKGAILIGIVATTVLSIIFGVTSLPEGFSPVSLPNSIEPVFMKMDFSRLLSFDMLAIVLTLVFTDLFDTAGILISICSREGMLDERGEVRNLNRAFLADALATCVGACVGSSTATSYLESATGVAAGGRTGLTAVVTAVMFLLSLLFAPLFSLVPMAAVSAALIVVGLLITSAISSIDFNDYVDAIPAFLTIIIIPLSYSIANGIICGFLVYVLLRVVLGKYREVSVVMYILALLFILKINC